MKALSIRQPWADLIMLGVKNVENRTWSTKHTGPLLIHAPKTIDENALKRGVILNALGVRRAEDYRPVTGAILGEVTVQGCVEMSTPEGLNMRKTNKWYSGPFGFVLSDPQLWDPPVPCPGKQGLFDVELSKEEGNGGESDESEVEGFSEGTGQDTEG